MSHNKVVQAPHAHLRQQPFQRQHSDRERVEQGGAATGASSGLGSSQHQEETNESHPVSSSSRVPHSYMFPESSQQSRKKRKDVSLRLQHQLFALQEVLAVATRHGKLLCPHESKRNFSQNAQDRSTSSSGDYLTDPRTSWSVLTQEKIDKFYQDRMYEDNTPEPNAQNAHHFARIRFYCYVGLANGIGEIIRRNLGTVSATTLAALRLFKEYKHLQLSFNLRTRNLRRLGSKRGPSNVSVKQWIRERILPSPQQLFPWSLANLSLKNDSLPPGRTRGLTLTTRPSDSGNGNQFLAPEDSLYCYVNDNSVEEDKTELPCSPLSTSTIPSSMKYYFLKVPAKPLDPWDSGSFRLSPSLCLILLIRPFVELYRRLGRCLVHETVGDRENQYLEELFRLVDKYLLEPLSQEFSEIAGSEHNNQSPCGGELQSGGCCGNPVSLKKVVPWSE